MKVEQQLSSGLMVRQDVRQAVRFVMFETGVEGWDYATHGGTMLILYFAGRPFGVSCQHVRRDFHWRELVVTDQRFGRHVAGLNGVYFPTQPVGDAVGSDVMDLVVVEFSDDVGPSFFGDNAYLVDAGTVGSSRTGDILLVSGALKDQSTILDETIAPVFALLEFEDRGAMAADPVLRLARARFANPEFSRLTGLSGSPVFDVTTSRLTGLVVRGGMTGADASIRYVDFAHVVALLSAIVEGAAATYYKHLVAK